jgi:hypothetical protein
MIIDYDDQEPTNDWVLPIKTFIQNWSLPNDNAEEERVTHKSRHYVRIYKILFHRGTNDMMMKFMFIGVFCTGK